MTTSSEPTPAGTGCKGATAHELSGPKSGQRQYGSLKAALEHKRVPVANHELITRIVEHLDIVAYYETAGYVRAVRRGAGPDLNIAYGWTNGFSSAEEVVAAAGDSYDPWPSPGRPRLYGVDHPENRTRPRHTPRKEERDYGTCHRCHLKLLPAGACSGGCDD